MPISTKPSNAGQVDAGEITKTLDLGENTLTICVGSAHTHCGVPDGSLDTLIDHLHALLVDGVGLSWATAAPEKGD